MGAKMWLRIREFLRYAMPILVLGSVVLSLLEYFDVTRYLNAAVLPITKIDSKRAWASSSGGAI